MVAALASISGCGSSSDTTAKFKSGYDAVRGPLNQTGQALGAELQHASGQTDAQVEAIFRALATRFQGQLGQLESLKPPGSVQTEWNSVIDAAHRLETDLNSVADAAATHNKSAAEQAGASLVTDAAALKSAVTPIKSKLGLK